MRLALRTAALLALTALPLAAQSDLTALEREIAAAAEARGDAAILLLRDLVNVNSGTMNVEGVAEVGRMLRAEFDALGLETEWIDGAPYGRAGHLVVRHQGTGDGPHLLLIGHLDTVFEPDSPFQSWEFGPDSTATGPGVVDMKGGDVVILEALRALQAADALDEMTFTVVMTGDEERPGSPLAGTRAPLIEAARAADIAVAFENGDSDPTTAVVARRGSTGWRLDVTGTPAHSSQLFQPSVGAGAIYEMSRILTGFYERIAGEALLTFNPGVVLGGTAVEYDPVTSGGTATGKSNVVAESAVVTGDLRAISIEQVENTRELMRFITRQSLPGTSAEITFDDGYPPLAPAPGNYALLELFSAVSEDLGYGPVDPVDPRNAGAADVSFTAGLVEMAIDGLGPGGGNDHTVDEWIDLPTLLQQTRRAAVFLHRLSRGVTAGG